MTCLHLWLKHKVCGEIINITEWNDLLVSTYSIIPNHNNNLVHLCCSGSWTLTVATFPQERPCLSLVWEGPSEQPRGGPGACCQPLGGMEGDSWVSEHWFNTFWKMRCTFSLQRGIFRMPFCTWLFNISTFTFPGKFIISCLPQCWVEVSLDILGTLRAEMPSLLGLHILD